MGSLLVFIEDEEVYKREVKREETGKGWYFLKPGWQANGNQQLWSNLVIMGKEHSVTQLSGTQKHRRQDNKGSYRARQKPHTSREEVKFSWECSWFSIFFYISNLTNLGAQQIELTSRAEAQHRVPRGGPHLKHTHPDLQAFPPWPWHNHIFYSNKLLPIKGTRERVGNSRWRRSHSRGKTRVTQADNTKIFQGSYLWLL